MIVELQIIRQEQNCQTLAMQELKTDITNKLTVMTQILMRAPAGFINGVETENEDEGILSNTDSSSSMNDTDNNNGITFTEYATQEFAVRKTDYTMSSWGGTLHMVPNSVSLKTGTVFIKWHMGDEKTYNVPLKYLKIIDIDLKSVSTFKKASSLMQKLMQSLVENGGIKRNMSLSDINYDDIVHLVEKGMKILRINASSSGIDTSKRRNFLETPSVTFYESLIPKMVRKRKLDVDNAEDAV